MILSATSHAASSVDFHLDLAENWVPDHSLTEEPLATQPERVASLEQSMKIVKGALTVLVPSLLLWGWYMTTNLVAIKQQLVDGGNKQIVAQLVSPGSPEKLKAALAIVAADVQSERANSRKPNAEQVAKLSAALSAVIDQHPQVPQAWQAASQLISFRSGPIAKNQSGSGNCWAVPYLIEAVPAGQELALRANAQASNCTVMLDDLQEYLSSSLRGDLRNAQSAHPEKVFLPPALTFTNVHVIYRGGQLPPVAKLKFIGCTFDFDVPSEPPGDGQILTRHLLAAKDLTEVLIPS